MRAMGLASLGFAALLVLGASANAGASAPTWQGPIDTSGTPTGPATATADPIGGVILYYQEYGAPALEYVAASGKAGPAVTVPSVPSLGNQGTPGMLAFLGNGGLVASWKLSSSGTDYMAYRSPAGKWGAPVEIGGTSVAARAGEVLVSQPGGPGVEADDWTLSSAGTLTHKAGPTPVLTGYPLDGQSWVALDTSGTAVIVTEAYTSTDEDEGVYGISRSKTGTWGTAQLLSGSAYVQDVVFASAPGGDAVTAWQNTNSDVTKFTSSAAVHFAGGGFSAATQVGAPSSTYFDFSIPIAAAGADGSLAVGVSDELGTGSCGSCYTTANSVWLINPGTTALLGPHVVPGTTNKFVISSLGASKGKAIVGIHEETITDVGGTDPMYSYNATQTTTADIIPTSGSASMKNFASTTGLYDGDGSDGCTKCDGTAPPTASVSGVALDGAGLAVAVGQLKPGGELSYAALPGKARSVPSVKFSSTKVTVGGNHAKVSLRCASAACSGTVKLTLKGKTDGSAPYSIAAGRSKSVSLTLTSAGKTAFKNARKHSVKATSTVTVKGGKTVVATVTVS